MKKLLLTLIVLSFVTFNVQAQTEKPATETKKVCHDKVVKGKTTQVCKNVKVHKKLEGTKVPEKNKK